jgi:hypothetical protein
MVKFEWANNFPSMTYTILFKIRTDTKKYKVFVFLIADVEEKQLLVILRFATSLSSPLSPSQKTIFEFQRR